ncbi:hypothetical protein ACTGZC_10355, partial [Streptococcus suis]
AKKLVHDNRNKKKNTDSSAEFHQNQLESICVFYLLASFCSASSLLERGNQWQFHIEKEVKRTYGIIEFLTSIKR